MTLNNLGGTYTNKRLSLTKLVTLPEPLFEVANQIDHKQQNHPFRIQETPAFFPAKTHNLIGRVETSIFVEKPLRAETGHPQVRVHNHGPQVDLPAGSNGDEVAW